MRHILGFAAALLCVSTFHANAADSATTSTKPNIIFIYSDDMGYGEVTANGKGAGVATPNIDRIAKEGGRFTQYYTASPICSPSRTAIITGQFPARHHINSYLQTRAGNRQCEQNDFLDAAASRLPVALKQAGYKTFHIGKWHLGGGRDVDNAPSIAKYGFDEFASTWESPQPEPALGVKYAPWDRRMEPGQVPRHKRTEYMVNRTLDFLKRHQGEPCFVNLWPDDMHTPHRPGPEMQDKWGGSEDEDKTPRKNHLGVLDEYDRQIGRLLDGIRDLGIEQNTIVIFSSDNGPEPTFNHERTGGLRGMKLSLYEGGIRLPFLARWPGHIPAGYVDDKSVICGVDIYLTLCNLAGVTLPSTAAKESDGEDRSQVILGKPAARAKTLFWEYGRKSVGYGYPRLPSDRSPNVATREGDWKLIINDNGTSAQLFNIAADPQETKDVAKENPAVTEKLSQSALAWRKTLPGRSADQDTTLSAKPNILLILADDMGYSDCSIQGAKDIPTPNIDSIGRAGIRFTNGYVSCPICGPTRAGLLTGRYQQRFGFETNNGPEIIAVPEYGVQRDQKMLSEYLKETGFATGMFGKWHLGFRPELTPPQRGFDTFFGFTSGYHGYYPDKPAPHSGPIVRGNTPVEESEYLTTAFGREASKFIQDNARRPFFLYLPFNAVHSPMQAPKDIEDQLTSITRPRRRTLAAMTIAMDRAIGRVLNTLRENSLEDNTLVIFLSDNGSPFENDPLRGHKGQCYEGGIRIPFMVQWKGHIAGGRVENTPVSSLDLLPTIMAAAGLPLPKDGIFDGKNILPSLTGNEPFPDRTLFWRFYDGKKSRAVREGDWKLVSEGGPWELYNVATDVSETSNTASQKPELVQQLEAKWNQWNSQMIDPKWHGQAPPKTPDPTQKAVTTGTAGSE